MSMIITIKKRSKSEYKIKSKIVQNEFQYPLILEQKTKKLEHWALRYKRGIELVNSRKEIKDNKTIKPLKCLYTKVPPIEPKVFNLTRKSSTINIYGKKSQAISHGFNSQIENLWVACSMPNTTLKLSGKAVPISEIPQESLVFSKTTNFQPRRPIIKTNTLLLTETFQEPQYSLTFISPWQSVNHSLNSFDESK